MNSKIGERVPEVYYFIEGEIPELQQPSCDTCWIATATMLVSWRDKIKYTFEEVAEMAGNLFFMKLEKLESLNVPEFNIFCDALKIVTEPPTNYTVEGLAKTLEKFGPLMIGTIEYPINPDDTINEVGHLWVLIGIKGDGSLENTNIQLIDPFDGFSSIKTFEKFNEEYENVFYIDKLSSEPIRTQLVHV